MSFASFLGNARVIFNYLKSDLIKKQRAFKIGLISIYLVVFFITMLLNLISLSAMIFIRVSEDQVGEADFVMVPLLSSIDVAKSNSSFDKLVMNPNQSTDFFDIKFIDFDDLKDKLKNNTNLYGVAPRWMLSGNTSTTSNWAVSNLFIIDSKLENKQGMGRLLHLHTLGMNECFVSESLYKSLQLSDDNNDVNLEIKLSSILSAFGKTDIGSIINNLQGEEDNRKHRKRMFSVHRTYHDGKHYTEEEDDDDNNDNDSEINEVMYNMIDKDNFNIRSFIKKLNIDHITIKKEHILHILNITQLPTNVSLSLSLLDSPLTSNLPFINTVKHLLTTNSSILHEFITIDNTTNKLRLKPLKDEYHIQLNIDTLLNKFTDVELEDIASFQIPLKVKETVPQTSGKWPSASGNVIAIDSNYMKTYLQTNFERILKALAERYESQFVIDVIEQFVNNFMMEFNINKYALTVNGIIKDKFQAYKLKSSKMRQYMSKQSEEIMNALGQDYPLTMTMPIYTTMQTVEIAKVFLENIFIAITVFLWILSVLLIYSILMGNVDERTYEFGMLRSLGYRKANLIAMIIIQGFIFAIPGVILGLISSYIANNYISFLLNWYTGIVMPYFLNGTTIALGCFIGISIPLIASYFPIKKALDANLKETLTIFNKKIGDLVVSMVKLENYGISLSSFLASIVIIAIGFSTYYVAPLSFLLMDPSIFVFIMIMILIVMLLGLVILIQLFIPALQRLVLRVLIFIAYKDRNIHFLVKKNLEGHQSRNKKVSIMFMMALGFIIFAGCTLNLTVDFVKTLAMSMMGGDAVFWVLVGTDTLNENVLKNYLETTAVKFPDVLHNYSFISTALGDMIGHHTGLHALNGYPDSRKSITAVDRNFVYAGFPDLYAVTSYDESLNKTYIEGTSKVDLISMLYDNPNIPPIIKNDSLINFPINPNYTNYVLDMQFNVIVAEGQRKSLAISVDNPCSLSISTFFSQRVACKVVGLASKLPGFPSYSSYSSLSMTSPAIISLDQMKEVLDKEMSMYDDIYKRLNNSKAKTSTPDGISKQGLLIKFKPDVTQKMKNMVYSEIKNLIDASVTSFLVDDIIETANTVGDIMGYIFLVLGIIALILSFFLIWTSFYANIKESICEYGITRSIGVTISQSTRIYLYEAASIIISSIITGTFIGVVISTTLILQFNVFVELPFIFNFPTKLYVTLVVFGLFMGMLGSYYPTYEVNHMSLVKIMKGLSE